MITVPHATPIKNSCSDSVRNQNGRIVKDKLDIYLQGTLSGLVHRELGIVDFVKLVYDFEPHRIPQRGHFTLLERSCIAFCNATNEFDSYRPLEEIIEDLKGQLFPDIQTAPLVLNLYPCGRWSPRGDHGNFKPDFFLSTERVDKWRRHCWTAGLGYGEVKRSEAGKKGTRKLNYANYKIDLDVLTRVSIDQFFICMISC